MFVFCSVPVFCSFSFHWGYWSGPGILTNKVHSYFTSIYSVGSLVLIFIHTVPVTFVDYYKADYPVVSPATVPEDYQFYFVFLRENLFDSSTSDVREGSCVGRDL